MKRLARNLLISTLALLVLPAALLAGDANLSFSKPTNNQNATVKVEINPGKDVPVTIPPNTSASRKRDLIRDALKANGYDVTDDGANGAALTIKHLKKGTTVKFHGGGTGEGLDKITVAAALRSSAAFEGHFTPLDYRGQPAIFTAGLVTEVGVLSAQVSAQELNFQTDGPIICQALFQRLAPRAPQYGAQINFAGDRLEVYFDPAYTITQGGILFGTTSLSPGCSGQTLSAGAGPDGLDLESVKPAPPAEAGGVFETGVSELEYSLAGGEYCEYTITKSDCSDLQVGDVVCVNCPAGGSCPATLAFVILNENGGVECVGTWRRSGGGSCSGCDGKKGYKFKE